MQSVSQNNKLCFYSLTDFTDSTDLSLGRLLLERQVAVGNMKICVIRAIREPKLLSMFYSLTDITDSTDMEPWAALCDDENLCEKGKRRVMILSDVTYQIRGAIYNVYNELGPGLLESVYEEALVCELEMRGIAVERQVDVPIMYKGKILASPLRLDLLVEGQVIVELKSIKELQDVHFKQLLTYCKLADKQLGILVNFNTSDIVNSIRRVAN